MTAYGNPATGEHWTRVEIIDHALKAVASITRAGWTHVDGELTGEDVRAMADEAARAAIAHADYFTRAEWAHRYDNAEHDRQSCPACVAVPLR